MQIRKLAWLLSGTAAMLGLFAVVPEVRSEITNLIEQPAPHLKTGQRLISSDNLELQCWQQGIKIIDEEGLGGVSVSTLLQQESVSFGAATGRSPTVLLLSLDEATCLVRARE